MSPYVEQLCPIPHSIVGQAQPKRVDMRDMRADRSSLGDAGTLSL